MVAFTQQLLFKIYFVVLNFGATFTQIASIYENPIISFIYTSTNRFTFLIKLKQTTQTKIKSKKKKVTG